MIMQTFATMNWRQPYLLPILLSLTPLNCKVSTSPKKTFSSPVNLQQTEPSVPAFVVYHGTSHGSSDLLDREYSTTIIPLPFTNGSVKTLTGLWLVDELPDGPLIFIWESMLIENLNLDQLTGLESTHVRCGCNEDNSMSQRSSISMYTTIFSNGNIESSYYSGNELGGGTYSCNALAQKYIDHFWELNKDISEDETSEQKKESPDERQYDSSEEDDEEHDFCTEIDNKGYIDALTFTGGTLYGAGIWDNQGCSGVHILDAFDTTTQLVKTPPHFPKQESTPQHCQKREWDSVPWPFDPEVPMVDFANEDEGEVYSCENTEATIYQLRNSHLIEVQIGADAIGGACACELMTPLSPQNCPSLADPCGDPQPFSQALESWPEFWIANDGSAALVRNETDFGILLPKQTKPHLINFTINEDLSLLGVRFHQDIKPLLRSIKSRNQTPKLIHNRCPLTPNSVIASTAKLAEDDKGYEDPRHGRGWGNRCFSHFKAGRISEAQAACERGLQLAEDSSVRGALFYNLGRISQARGDLERAVEFYTVSLQLRPNQPSVQNQLEQAKKQVNPATSSYP